jgi:hypothetical protein
MIHVHNIFARKPENDNMVDMCIDERTLKCVLRKYAKAWTGFKWFRIWSTGMLFRTRQ